jgi:X-X-X-Leu-X-X-Gly heptad repeat protein
MNRTLLLIICDFLLLNLLALTRWEKAEPPATKRAPVPELAANAVTKEQELVETMRQSLADEKAVRDELAQKLSSTDAALAAREQSLAQVQTEREKIAADRSAVAARLGETQRAVTELSQKVGAATQEASMTRDQLAQLQRELAEKQEEANRQRLALTEREKQLADVQRQNQVLSMAVVLGEQEKKTLRETTEALKGQVEQERAERAKVQEATTQLAQGVGQLAEKSGELTREIRDHRPINANVLFSDYLANRVTAAFSATRKGFLGPVQRAKDATTVLVSDGRQVYALLHVAETVFSFGENGLDWEGLSVGLSRSGSARTEAREMQFLAHDPRIVVIPVELSQATMLGARVYPLAADPFKFPDAVLIDGGGRGYGEVGFKLDPAEPRFVRVDNRLFKRIFGDFAPKRGDLVLAKTGELLGIMVNNDYCALLKDFASQKVIPTGADIRGQATGAIFDALISRVKLMPMKLQ